MAVGAALVLILLTASASPASCANAPPVNAASSVATGRQTHGGISATGASVRSQLEAVAAAAAGRGRGKLVSAAATRRTAAAFLPKAAARVLAVLFTVVRLWVAAFIHIEAAAVAAPGGCAAAAPVLAGSAVLARRGAEGGVTLAAPPIGRQLVAAVAPAITLLRQKILGSKSMLFFSEKVVV